jgi:hypothetical protein
MLPTAYIDACTTIFYFCKFFLAVPIFVSQETSEKIPAERLFLRKMVVLQETYLALGCWLACCFCFVSTSYLPLSSWCGQSRWPDWACIRLIAHVGAPGNLSWSLRHWSADFSASHALGSLWGISRRWWSAWSNDANLALAVPGRLFACGRA